TGARKLAYHGVLDQAGRTPRSPDVQDPHLAEHVLLREGLVGRIEQRQLEARRRLADQRRGHLARVQTQADRQETHQDNEAGDDGKNPHAATSKVFFCFIENRYRRSLAANTPPSAMMKQPSQIQSTKGLCWTLTSQVPLSSSGSPSET